MTRGARRPAKHAYAARGSRAIIRPGTRPGRQMGDAHDADLTTPDPLPRRRRRAAACRPRRGFRAGSRRSGAQDHPLFRHARGGAAIVPGRAADRPGVAPARARRRGAPDGAPAAQPGGLVRARALGRHHVAHGRPARAQRPGRARVQPLPLVDGAARLQFRRLQEPGIRQDRGAAAPGGRHRSAQEAHPGGASDRQPRRPLRLSHPPEDVAGLQPADLGRRLDRHPKGRRHPEFLDLRRRGAEGRATHDDHQLRHAASGDPPALHRRRARQLGQRARLGPARARRAGRAATPLGGGELHLRQRPHRRRDDPRRHDLP